MGFQDRYEAEFTGSRKTGTPHSHKTAIFRIDRMSG